LFVVHKLRKCSWIISRMVEENWLMHGKVRDATELRKT
jgi:hypothetical protein